MSKFYEEKAEVTFEEVKYSSSLAIISKEELLGEWQVFKRAVFQEKKVKKYQPSIFATSYAGILPETFKILIIFLALPTGTASVVRSFSHLKMIITSYAVAYQTVV